MVEQKKEEVHKAIEEVSSREIARMGRFALREITFNVPKEAVEEVSTREICRVGRFILTETTYEIRTLPEDLPFRQTPYLKIKRE